MRRIDIDPVNCTVGDLTPAVEWLRAGKIVAFPTDTLYGLLLSPNSAPGNRIHASQRSIETFAGTDDFDGYSLLAVQADIQTDFQFIFCQQ